MERPLSVQRWNVPTRPRNCAVDAAAGTPQKKLWAERILDAAIRHALQRIARFAFETLLGNNYSAAYGHVRSCYLSAAQCLEPACSSSPVRQYASRFGRETMLTKPTSVQLGCSHLIEGNRLVR